MNTSYEAFVVERFSLGTGGLPELPYCTLAMCGEAGETAEKVKKLYRDKNGVLTEGDRSAILKELGDTLFYLTMIAHLLDYKLHDVMHSNVAKLISRDQQGTRRGSGDDR